MACIRLTVLALCLTEGLSMSVADNLFVHLRTRMQTTSSELSAWELLRSVSSAAVPDLVALLCAGAFFYFLSYTLVVPKRVSKVREPEEESSEISQIPEISGCTSLHWAAHNGLLREVENLLHAGADANAMDNYHETPLHMAARGGYEDICSLLLDYGAKPQALNKNHKTPSLIAALSGHAELCGLLNPGELTRRTLQTKALPVESDLKDWSRSPEGLEHFGCNELHWAALRCSLREVCSLLAAGVPLDLPDPWGDTALHLAARAGCLEVCGALCAARANVRLVNKEKKSALDIARCAGHHDICKLLQDFL
ncbi:unnamed protein product [Effrenium voratum]|nr:unnamed protein product [Effrenium voratum]|mmetsp:Transcript_129288/g.306792  ORF Transcript_129288/g.306792 Transcript_129288/m.306792 type:complete len:311 (+) Transcript_129288:107-1039(+)